MKHITGNYLVTKGWILFFLILPLLSTAQKTEKYKSPVRIYQDALELFRNQKYAASREKFEEYIEVGENRLLIADAYFYRAQSAMELFQLDTEKLFLQYLDKFPEMPKAPKVYFELGKYKFRSKDYPEAREYLAEVDLGDLDRNEVSEYYFMQGYSYFKEENYDEAQKAFGKILDKDNPYFAKANYYIGYIAYQRKDYATAIKHFKEIEDDQQFSKVVPVYITQFYLLQEEYDQAISYGEQALAKDRVGKKDDIEAYVAEAYYSKGNYQKVVDLLGSKSSLNDGQRYKLAFSYFKTGEYQSSINQFSRLSISEDSLGQNIAYHMGGAYLKTEEKEKARNAFKFASEQDFNSEITKNALFNYAKLSYDLNYQKNSIASFQEFIKKYPKTSKAEEAKSLLGDILLSTKNYKEALDIIEKIPEKNEKIRTAFQKISYHYGLDLFERNNYSQAREAFINSLKYQNDGKYKALAYFWLGESYYQLREYEKAFTEYQNFLFNKKEAEKMPYYPVGFYNAGYANFKLENYDGARPYFKKFLELEAGKPESKRYNDGVVRLADCYYGTKDYPQALTYYNRIIEEGTQESDYAIYQKGIILGLMDQPREKIEVLTSLQKKYPSSSYVDDAMFEVANEYFIAGNFQKALEKFRSLMKEYPKSPYYRVSLLKSGLVYYSIEEDRKALKSFKFIAKKYPHSMEARDALKGIKNIYTDLGKGDSFVAFVEKNVPNANITLSLQDSISYESAFSYYKKNNCTEAIPALKKYLAEFTPKNGFFVVNANYYLADCAERSGKKEEALKGYEEVISRSPNQFMEKALKGSATLYYEKNDCGKALERYSQLQDIANIRQNELLAMKGKMRCNYKLKNHEMAIENATKILNLNISDKEDKMEAQYYLGKTYFDQHQYELATTHLKPVSGGNIAEFGAEATYLLASIDFLNEQFDEAQSKILRLKNQFANYDYWVARGFILLADIFVKIGDDFQAKHTLKSIIENYEGGEIVRIAKEKLSQINQREQEKKSNSALDSLKNNGNE